MGSFGLSEIILIAIVGFLLLGPEKLPGFLRKMGQFFGELTKIKNEFKKSIEDIKEPIDEVKNEIKNDINDINRTILKELNVQNNNLNIIKNDNMQKGDK